METFDVVRVVNKRSRFLGHHGFVDKAPEGRASDQGVWVTFLSGVVWRALLDSGFRPGERTVLFRERDLVRDEDVDPMEKASILFGEDIWHACHQKKSRVLDPTALCDHDGCDGRRTRRIMVNIWGAVCEVDVCVEHAKLNRHCMDDFPWRKVEPVPAAAAPKRCEEAVMSSSASGPYGQIEVNERHLTVETAASVEDWVVPVRVEVPIEDVLEVLRRQGYRIERA